MMIAELGALGIVGTMTGWKVQAQPSAGIPRPDHVVIVIEENRGYVNTIGSGSAPYINALAQRGASFTESYAIAHPSQPNYLALFSGSTQSVSDDSCPHHFNGPNLGTALLDAGFTFAGYSESLPSVGSSTCESGLYARKHVPWINFLNVPARTHLPFSQFPSDFSQLPTVAFVIPNEDNDMHSGSTQQGDAWLQKHIDAYVQWAQTNNSLFILTWDEGGPDNRIPTIFVGPMVQSGMYCGRINHYHVLRTLEDMFGLPYAGLSARVPPIANVWTAGNPPPQVAVTSPAEGAMFTAPTDVTLTAEASSTAGAITKVEFFSGVKKLGQAVGSPYAITWTNVPPGHWCLTAKVTDEHGNTRASQSIGITVTGTAGNPFLAVKGAYSGLFICSNQLAFTNCGFFTLNTTAQGTFAGRLLLGGAKYPLHGRFDQFGAAHASVKRSGQTPLDVDLNLDLFGSTDKLHGSISDGTWIATLDGDHVIRSVTNAVPQPGRYTLLIPGSADASDFPGGYGFGSVTVNSAGQVKFDGTLGDGTRTKQTVVASKEGRWPFFTSLYGGAGAILGWVTFDAAPLAGFHGELDWFKLPTQHSAFYPSGFNVKTSISGSVYEPSTAGERLLHWTNGVAVLAGGNLVSSLTNQVTLEADNTITVVNNGEQLKVGITLRTGAVNGSFVHPVTHQTTYLDGVVQRKLGVIGGVFLGTSETGSLFIGPAGP